MSSLRRLEGATATDLARAIGSSASTARRRLTELLRSGLVAREWVGRGFRWVLSIYGAAPSAGTAARTAQLEALFEQLEALARRGLQARRLQTAATALVLIAAELQRARIRPALRLVEDVEPVSVPGVIIPLRALHARRAA